MIMRRLMLQQRLRRDRHGHTFLPAAMDADVDTDGYQPREADEVMGYLPTERSGTYTCAAAATTECTVTLNGNGKVATASPLTGYSPPSPSNVTVAVANTDYLAYGIWLKRTTDKDGATTYDEVEAFFTSNEVA